MVWSQFSIKIFGVNFGNSVLENSNWDKISHSLTKKSHTCEEVGTHLRSSFWCLLMNFENRKNQALEKMKTFAGDIIILHMCTKTHNHMWCSSWDTKWDIIFCHFGPFFAFLTPSTLTTQKTKILKKWKKHLEMSSF